MSDVQLLHRRLHTVSHFQIFLMDGSDANAYPDYGHGSSLATFGPQGVAVSTAWDENGTTDAQVELAVSGFGEPSETSDHLKAVADGQILVGGQGVVVGNVITGDVAVLDLPEGRYAVTVFADVLMPFTARSVRFHLMRL